MKPTHRARTVLTTAAIAALVLAVAGCPGSKGQTGVDNPTDPKPGDKPVVELPEVAATFEAQRIAPESGHDPSARSPILDSMLAENQRWMQAISKAKGAPAYYLGYSILHQRVVSIDAEGGAVVSSEEEIDRYLDVEVRVGSPALDNRRPLSDDERGVNEILDRQVHAPFGTDALAIQQALWLETDRRYREAAQQLYYVNQDSKLAPNDRGAPDFVLEKPEVFIQPQATLEFDEQQWTERVKECSKKALKGVATRGSCSVLFELNTLYFVNSEGTQLQMSWPNARIVVSVGIKADDGESLNRLEQRFARTPAGLPGDAEIDQMIKTATTDLDALHKAPRADPYVGPSILEGRAAGVFFHEVFGHRIEGHRQKEKSSGRTFASAVGKEIMPTWLTVYDDPTVTSLNGQSLNGFYRFDDEGVRAQRAPLVTQGVLKGFVLGRNPIPGFTNSNGHGRKQLGRSAVSRQGNLVVEAARSVPDEELEKMLIAEVKRQKKPFGMIVTDIKGGFTLTTTDLPQSFKVEPVMAYRLYPDGRKELVRGVDIVGTPLTALGDIMAAGRTMQTFNGICGAESGWVPVSASAPSLLLQKLEVERKAAPQDRSPIMPQPAIRATTRGLDQ
ncbi:MAG TPA: metallopeptidase TldD-related protein [Kofleriaceae bacterium]|nr:metallopeptidase TldD-related protein [Kofleriaceae bacterium]